MAMKNVVLLILLASIAVASTLSIFALNLVELGFKAMDIAFVRLVVATVVLFIIILVRSRDSLRINKKDIFFLIMFGVFKYLMDYTFYLSLSMCTVSLASLLQNTAPYFVIIVSFFILRERVSKLTLLSVMMGSFGCILMSGKALLGSNFEPMGIVYAMASAFCLAMFIIGSDRSLKKGYSAVTYLFYVLLVATVVSIPFADLGTIVSRAMELDVLFNSLVLGIMMTLLPFYAIAWSVKYLNATTVSVICVLEVVFAAMVGAFYFGEALDLQDVLGIAMMVGSIVLISKIESKSKKEELDGDAVKD